MLRTHEAGTLRADHAGQTVTLTGLGGAASRPRWRRLPRPAGRVGVAQVVARDEVLAEGGAHGVRNEFYVKVTGEVRLRPEGNANPELPTGEIEVIVSELEVLNTGGAAALPDRRARRSRRGGPPQAPLPRPASSRRELGARHPAALAGQRRGPVLGARDFVEIETPPDARSTPEGAATSWCPPASPGFLVRAAAEPAAVQAAAHGAGWSATTRSPAATATRTSAPTASRSSPSSTSRCPSSSRTTSSSSARRSSPRSGSSSASSSRRRSSA